MKDFPFSFDQLTEFSNSDPYGFVPAHYQDLFERLERTRKQLSFPAVCNGVGSALAFILPWLPGKRIFEMGSGYGHSAFWYFIGAQDLLERVVLTEKRSDLQAVYEDLPWPINWKRRMEYWQGDAFEKLAQLDEDFDLFLVDGVKADYRRFVELAVPRLSPGGLIAIDNSYWRGSFLNAQARSSKQSAANIFELHQWIKERRDLQAIFLPYRDGLTLVRKTGLS